MGALLAHIHDIITKNGPLTVADYMELALQHPEHGYYRQHDPLGKDGDFTTAPEISQMFGEMIGLWCADVWRQMGKPEKFGLLELGPGRGTLMQDALRATAKISGFHQALNLQLLESNVTLRKIQQEKLAEYVPLHLDDLTELLPLPTIIIANEFFDALPIRQFEKNFPGWCERLITVEDGKLSFTLWPLDEAFMALIPPDIREALPGTVHEIAMLSMTVTRSLAKHIAQFGGAGLFIDYGYAESSGKPTLQAVAKHEFADPLVDPGAVDLTVHVDFLALKKVALMQKINVLGPIGQGEFLETLGIDLRAGQLKQRATDEQAIEINSALHRLTDSSQMGSLFKVMALASSQLSTLPGF